jgi:hypothetical protein
VDCICERPCCTSAEISENEAKYSPQVCLVHGLVVYVGRVGKSIARRLAVVFLLVHDEMLSVSNDTGILDTLDGFSNSNTSQNRIGTEA